MRQFRVVDLRPDATEPEQFIKASSPEAAAANALGSQLVRGNRGRGKPVCRVYWQDSTGETTMIKMYTPSAVGTHRA